MVVIGSAGVLAPGKWRWLRAFVWMVALAAACVVAFNAVATGSLWLMALATGVSPASAGDGARLVAAIAGSIFILVIYRLATGLAERRPVTELGLRRAPAELLLGATVGALVMSVIIGILWLAGWVLIEPKPIDGIALALRDSIRSGVVEELLLRLVIFRLLWRVFGVWPAIVGAALLFGILHLSNPDSSLFAALALIAGEGIAIGLYLLTGRIWASIAMHAAWNFTQGWLFGAAVSGTSGIAGGPMAMRPVSGAPELLSGGGFGPEASLAALAVSLLASIGFLRLAWRRGRFVAADA